MISWPDKLLKVWEAETTALARWNLVLVSAWAMKSLPAWSVRSVRARASLGMSGLRPWPWDLATSHFWRLALARAVLGLTPRRRATSRMARPERTRARKAAQSTSTFLVMGEVSYSPEVIHGALSGISIIAGDHLGVFVLPLAPVGLGFAFKFGTGGGAQAAGEFDSKGDGIGVVRAARIMPTHFGLGFDADFFVTHLP